jgi:hypothetical protein
VEEGSNAVILSPFAVILSAAKDLALPLRVNCAKNLALPTQGKLRKGSRLSVFEAKRDSSFAMLRTTAAPENDCALRIFSQPAKPGATGPSGISRELKAV